MVRPLPGDFPLFEWGVVCDQWPVISGWWSVVGGQFVGPLLVTSHWLLATDHLR